MEGPVTERDWKYLRSIKDEMLYALCLRINEKAVAIGSYIKAVSDPIGEIELMVFFVSK
jgi:hypothetical protein